MYVLNADTDSLLSFNPTIQKYLIKNGVPFLKKIGQKAYFAKSKILKRTIRESPDWVKREVNIE